MLSLKLNDFNIIFQNMHRLFRAMTVLELPNKSEYCKSMLMNLIFMHHSKAQNSVMWRAFREDPSCFNEEKGESALGTLARIQNGKGNGTKLDITNAKWALIHQHSAVCDAFINETLDWDNANRPVTIEKECESVLHTRTWLERTIRQLKTNRLQVCTDRDLLAFEREAQLNMEPVKKVPVFLEMEFEAQVRKRIPAFSKQQESFWVDRDSPKDMLGNTRADRQLAWPVPAGAPQPEDVVSDAEDKESCSDDSTDAEEPVPASVVAAAQSSDDEDDDDDMPLAFVALAKPRISAVAAASLHETEADKAARLRTATEKRQRKKRGRNGQESRCQRWDYQPVLQSDDEKEKSVIVTGKRATRARNKDALKETDSED